MHRAQRRAIVPIVSNIAAELFSSVELNGALKIQSADDLWSVLERGAAYPLKGAAAPLFSGSTVVYRGQADANYGLSSSLYRLCRSALRHGRVAEAHLQAAEQAIILAARQEGIGRRMTDGELLMVLQHHGIPTRLVDVSAGPLEALFFAVDRDDAAAGRLIIVDLHDETPLRLGTLDPFGPKTAKERQLPWAGQARGGQSVGTWTDTVALVAEAPLDARMRAQAGQFLVGGLNRRYGGRAMYVRGATGREIRAAEFPEVATLSVNFVQQRRLARSGSWPLTGWTLRVEPEWKPVLRERLAGLDDAITEDTMYPPLAEVRRLASVEARRAVEAVELPRIQARADLSLPSTAVPTYSIPAPSRTWPLRLPPTKPPAPGRPQ